jgi:thiamine phosphate synthase YjbQ (UPF0047 family)
MTTRTSELKLTLVPRRRFQAIDVTARIAEASDLLRTHQQALYCSLHTTAGYLCQSLSARMNNRQERLSQFFRAFHALFPEGAEYRHDQMDLRTELSDDQKVVEPRNGDSHLTFIGAGMSNCVTYRTSPRAPVYFIELDGMYGTGDSMRERQTVIVGFKRERIVAQTSLGVPVSKHPIDSVNLADARLGVLDYVNELLQKIGVERARVDLVVGPAERNVGLTVNEYETLLIKNDLMEVLKNPLRFARLKGRHMIDDPFAIPAKTLSYAQYDAVRVLNSLMEALRLDQSSFERLVAKVMSVPARCFFRSRRVSFLATGIRNNGATQLLRGTYQSPILVQWKRAEGQTRRIDIRIVELQ